MNREPLTVTVRPQRINSAGELAFTSTFGLSGYIIMSEHPNFVGMLDMMAGSTSPCCASGLHANLDAHQVFCLECDTRLPFDSYSGPHNMTFWPDREDRLTLPAAVLAEQAQMCTLDPLATSMVLDELQNRFERAIRTGTWGSEDDPITWTFTTEGLHEAS